MKRVWILLVTAGLMAAACASPPSPSPTAPPTLGAPTSTPPPTATPYAPATSAPEGDDPSAGMPLIAETGEYFTTSGICVVCHSNMIDGAGQDVSLDTMWRTSTMANSGRDPYWQASLRAEVLSNPGLREEIEDECARCHMTMAQVTAAAKGEITEVLEAGFLDPDNALHGLAMDGISCAVCHQIQETGLGYNQSYSGGFVIDTELESGERTIYGPYQIDPDQSALMQAASGYAPVQGVHISESEMCATCHTLYTPSVNSSGEIVGRFPEQMAYFEWFYSDYRNRQSCQDCHMPEASGGVRIATTSPVPRGPFSTHGFEGGNAYMLTILKTFGQELGVTASADQFDAAIERTVNFLQDETAMVEFIQVRASEGFLSADVLVSNLAGHKFPSSFPSRRAWLHFWVTDGAGNVVFESGSVEANGAIVGNDNDADPALFEPHYQTIGREDRVQIYESIMNNTRGEVTTTLLNASDYLKDNRLLPVGLNKGTAHKDIAVRGEASEDEDFIGGTDRVIYTILLGEAEGPFTANIELLYQSIGFRWADNLRRFDAPEIERFTNYYQSIPNAPVVVSSATAVASD